MFCGTHNEEKINFDTHCQNIIIRFLVLCSRISNWEPQGETNKQKNPHIFTQHFPRNMSFLSTDLSSTFPPILLFKFVINGATPALKSVLGAIKTESRSCLYGFVA